MRTNLPSALRALRRQRGWRQVDLGDRAGLSRDPVSRLERGRLGGVTIGSADTLASALGATLVVELRWQGADLDRLTDRAHAALQESTARRLASSGWLVQAEVTFNHYGDRGSCDLVGLHPATGVLLVVEVKSSLGNLQETLHRLDSKARLGPVLTSQLAWPMPTTVSRALVLGESGVTRRALQRHPALFARFSIRGQGALAWIRRPDVTPAALLWFERSPDAAHSGGMGGTRVRHARVAR